MNREGHPFVLRSLVASALLACAAPAPRVEPAPRFVFQSRAWVNLHHFLRAEARRQARGAALVQPLAELDPGEREAWTAALAAYCDLAQRNLLFDPELVRIHVALSTADEGRALDAGTVGEELTVALNGALPVFRAHLWPERSRANEEWIARTRPEVERLAAGVTSALAAAYRLDWPTRPILMDVTSDTGPNLAYTTNDAPPGFAGLATLNPSVEGGSPAAIECVFHEASHVVDAQLVRWIEEESARQGTLPPADLWHALLFYTSGELTRRALGTAGTFRADLEQGFPAYLPALDAHWLPYLDGEEALDDALRGLVREAAAARGAGTSG